MFQFRKTVLILLLAYVCSVPALAFNLPKQNDSTKIDYGAIEFFDHLGTTGKVMYHNTITDMDAAQAKIASTSKTVASGVFAVCVLTSIAFLAFNIVKLTKSADNPNERKKAILGIIISAAVFAGFGGYAVVTNMFLNFIQ